MLKNFDDWNKYEGPNEGSGRSEKIWLEKDGKIGLFKFPKKYIENGKETGELSRDYLSEKIATIIAEKIEIKTAKVDIGTRNGRIGCMSYNICESSEILVEGINFITSVYPNYDQNKLYDSENERYYGLNMIEESIKSVFKEIPEELYKMIIFDFIIGNSDRHHSNWAMKFTIKGNYLKYSFSPLYDNGSSLCSFIKEKDIDNFINTNDKMRVESLINSSSRSKIRINEKIKKEPTQLELITFLKKSRKDVIIEYVNYVKKKLTPECINDIIESFSDELISKKRKELLKFYLNKKIELLKNVFDKGEL